MSRPAVENGTAFPWCNACQSYHHPDNPTCRRLPAGLVERIGTRPQLQGFTVLRVWRGAVYLRIPAELQRETDGCSCTYCTAHPTEVPKWDTMAVPLKAGERSWTCHAPEWTVSDTPEVPR